MLCSILFIHRALSGAVGQERQPATVNKSTPTHLLSLHPPNPPGVLDSLRVTFLLRFYSFRFLLFRASGGTPDPEPSKNPVT